MGIFKQGGIVWALLCDLWDRRFDPAVFSGKADGKTDLYREGVGDAGSGVFWDHRGHDRSGTDRELYYGGSDRRMGVGLPQICF